MGDLKFVDTNGDGVITDDDRVLTGCYTPKQTYSFGGSFDWKGFDFSFMFQGVAGNYIYNGTKQMAMNGRADMGNLISDVYDTWDFNPSGSKYPRLGLVDDNNGNYVKFSDVFLEKGDYLRLKNITLGYTLPKHVTRPHRSRKGLAACLHEHRQRGHDHRLFGHRPRSGQLRHRLRRVSRVAFLQLWCERQFLNLNRP